MKIHYDIWCLNIHGPTWLVMALLIRLCSFFRFKFENSKLKQLITTNNPHS